MTVQHILGLVRRCVEDYNMIEAGETVAVGVSGGKDSLLTLTALARLRAFYPKPFRVEAITLETGMPGMDFTPVADYCAALDVPYTRISVPVYDIVFNERKEKIEVIMVREKDEELGKSKVEDLKYRVSLMNEKKSNVTAHGVGNDLLPAGDHGHGLGG